LWSEASPEQKHKTLSEKTNSNKKTWWESQVVVYLPGKLKALSSNPGTTKTKKSTQVLPTLDHCVQVFRGKSLVPQVHGQEVTNAQLA
jgi:hypothetical protein